MENFAARQLSSRVLQANDGVDRIAKMARRLIFVRCRLKPIRWAEIKAVLVQKAGFGVLKSLGFFY